MRPRRGAPAVAGALAVLLCCAGVASASHVNRIRVNGTINPASSDYIQQAIARSEEDGAVALVIELDTPGGLLSSTKDIIQAILNSRVPVVVYVAPQGAWAASAGTFITLAAHVAAMAPGTSIGAASPIGLGGGDQRDAEHKRTDVAAEKAEKFTTAFIESIAKARKRNVEWAAKAVRDAEAVAQDEALRLGVIDLVAPDLPTLLADIEGRSVTIGGESRKLELKGAAIETIPMTALQQLFNFLANPDVAVLLVMGGLLGIYIEVNTPGVLLPGILGGACLVLAAIAFQILPFSWVGLLVLLLGVGLLAAEIFVSSSGVLLAAGVACLLVGGTLVFQMPEVSDLTVSFWSVLVPAVTGFALFAFVVAFAVGRTFRRPQTAGVSELIGMVGRSETALAPDGKVFVRGEYWNATGEGEIPARTPVEVVAVEGMRLRVRRAEGR